MFSHQLSIHNLFRREFKVKYWIKQACFRLFTNLTKHCKKTVLDNFKNNGNQIIVIGDGNSDKCVAKNADKVFAKGLLKMLCKKNQVAFTEFKTFKDIINEKVF